MIVSLTLLAPSIVALAGALLVFPLRGRLSIARALTVATLLLATAAVARTDVAASGSVLGLDLRMSGLAQLVDLWTLAILVAIAIYVGLSEPVYNFFPVALFTFATVHGVLVIEAALPLFLVLVAALVAPTVALTFRVRENRSVEATARHFGSVVAGGSLGIAALALAAQTPGVAVDEELWLRLLLVLLVVAFALLLGALPFHGHLAFLSAESPAGPLALLVGALTPVTVVALPLLLAQSGLLPAVASIEKAQTALLALGFTSALGGGLLAVGAADLRRLVAYSVVSNVGVAMIGLATFSGPGVVGALGTALVTGAAAAVQFVAVGALSRAMLPEDPTPSARRAPLAAAAFALASLAIVGIPPIAGFPARFLVSQMTFALSTAAGAGLLAATLLLVVGHLRAALALFAEPIEVWRPERRPVAGAVGLAVLVALVAAGLYPDAYLRPLADFSREFLLALRPF